VTKANDKAFVLKGSALPLTVMHLKSADADAIENELKLGIANAPGLFNNTPMALDLESLSGDEPPDFDKIIQILRENGLMPVGVRNCPGNMADAAASAGLASLPKGVDQGSSSRQERKPSNQGGSKLIVRSLRSGQRVYAPGGDLTVIGSVSPGAEAIADGNIHVYGPLKGRALAGAAGDESARIFCLEFDAELTSIAGNYRLFEQTSAETGQGPAQIFLSEGRIIVEPLKG